MQIPFEQLSADTLTAILEEYASREGTEYGEIDYSLAQKVAMLRKQLERKEIGISFNTDTETCSLISLRQ